MDGGVLNLYEALGISSGDVVAFAGAGGKSSAIRHMAAELSDAGMSVVVAPTTKMGLTEIGDLGPLVVSESLKELLNETQEALESSSVVVLGGERISKDRIGGVLPEHFREIARLVDVVLVEADGARHRSIKGTAGYEPLLPDNASLVVAVGGIDALGKSVDPENVHRPEIFAELTGVNLGGRITATAFARALSKGSLRELPASARSAVLLTGVNPGQTMSDAAVVTRELWNSDVSTVVFANLSGEIPQVWKP